MNKHDENDLDLLTNQMHRLYVSEESRFVMMKEGGKRFVPKIGKRNMRLALSNLKRHMLMEYAIGTFAHKEGSKFFCLDIDADGNRLLDRTMEVLSEAGFDPGMIHLSSSGNKGFHVEIFADGLIDQTRMDKLHRYVLMATEATNRQIECRPTFKQSIKLPLSIHPDTLQVCWFLDRQTLKPIETQSYIFGIHQYPAERINRMIDELVINKSTDESSDGERMPNISRDEQSIFEPLLQAGTRHNRMANIAVYLRSHGSEQEYIRHTLQEWIDCQDSQMYKSSRAEVLGDIDNIVRWVCRRDFVVSCDPTSHVFVSSRDIQKIFSLTNKSERKLCLLLLACERAYKRLTQKQIAQLLDITDRSVRNLVTDLTARHIAYQRHGIVKKTQKGFFCRRASRYHVDLSQITLEKSYPMGETNFFWINVSDLLTDFQRQYFQLLVRSFPKEEILKGLSQKEKAYVERLCEKEEDHGFCSNGNKE